MKLLEIVTVTIILINVQADAKEVVKSCGRRLVNHKALIKNGFPSNEGDWPWQAAIYHIGVNLNIAFKCGGSIINSNSILTAAHCVYENGRLLIADRILVNLGQHNLKLLGRNTQQFEVYQIISHPSYNQNDYNHDIAILRLSTEATFTNYVQPICLWEKNKVELSQVTGKFGTVIGWGVTENDTISYILRQAVIPVVPTLSCLESNRASFGHFLSDNNFCAGFRNGTRICEGDSGGSMTFLENGVYRIRGIVSLSVSMSTNVCNSKDYVIFTDVAKYLEWIEEVLHKVQPYTAIIDTQPDTSLPRISVQKCNSYKEFAYDNMTFVNQVDPFVSNLKKDSNCPLQSPNGPSQASEREFPHQARIITTRYNAFYWSCQGSLISEQFVLSTAYCCAFTKYFYRFMRLGEYNISRTYDPFRFDVNIIESITHPKYELGSGIWYNDIGLFKLGSQVQFNSAIRPICLPSQSVVPSKSAITSAWGSFQMGEIESDVLLKVPLNIVPQAECSRIWGRFWNISSGIVEEKQLCATTQYNGAFFCEGYIGTPLQIYHENNFCTYTIVGIHNFGSYQCPDIGRPNVYTRVFGYLEWIESIVWPNE